jgi:CelD/BcsL family acetyltransferase involved in cellulose biosynthesis
MRIDVIKELSDLAPLEKDWESIRRACGGHLFSSYHWITKWYRHFPRLAEPRVVVLEHGGQVIGIAPLAYHSLLMKGLRIRTLWTAGWAGATHELQSVGPMCSEGGQEAYGNLLSGILKTNWNNLQFNGLPDSPQTASLHGMLSSKYHTEDVVRIPRPEVHLEGVEEILSMFSERSRRSTRKSLRTLNEDNRLESRKLTAPMDVSSAMTEYIEMHKARWSSKGGSIFNDRDQASFLLDSARTTAERGECAVYQTLIDGRVAAQALTLFDGDRACVYRLGTNDEFLEHVPGYLLFHFLLTDLKSRRFTTVDLGTGAEDFKYRIGAKDNHLVNLHSMRGSLALARRVSNVKGLDRIAMSAGFKKGTHTDSKDEPSDER